MGGAGRCVRTLPRHVVRPAGVVLPRRPRPLSRPYDRSGLFRADRWHRTMAVPRRPPPCRPSAPRLGLRVEAPLRQVRERRALLGFRARCPPDRQAPDLARLRPVYRTRGHARIAAGPPTPAVHRHCGPPCGTYPPIRRTHYPPIRRKTVRRSGARTKAKFMACKAKQRP
jgi:hypothetical protein